MFSSREHSQFLFQPKQPSISNETIFINAFNELFVLMGEHRTHFHTSELLREVANYYVEGMARHAPTTEVTRLQILCLELIEKAMAIEPGSKNAESNYHKLLTVAPMLSHNKGIYNEEIRQQRLEGYRDQATRRGSSGYFFEVIKGHLASMKELYSAESEDFTKILGNILDHMPNTNIFKHIVDKYLTQQRSRAFSLFTTAKASLVMSASLSADLTTQIKIK